MANNICDILFEQFVVLFFLLLMLPFENEAHEGEKPIEFFCGFLLGEDTPMGFPNSSKFFDVFLMVHMMNT